MKLNKFKFRLSRRGLYFTGVATAAFGLLVLVTVLLSVARSFGDLSEFDTQAKSIGTRALGGIALVAAGFAVMTLTDNGLTNGFVEIDRLRDEESPIDESQRGRASCDDIRPSEPTADGPPVFGAIADQANGSSPVSQPVLTSPEGFCCLACRAVNDQDARYCDQCGTSLRSTDRLGDQPADGSSASSRLSQTAV